MRVGFPDSLWQASRKGTWSYLESLRRKIGAIPGARRQRAAVDQPGLALHPCGMLLERLSCRGIDDRPDIGGDQAGVADRQLRHRAGHPSGVLRLFLVDGNLTGFVQGGVALQVLGAPAVLDGGESRDSC